MRVLEFVIVRLLLWVALPGALGVLLIGPSRVKGWFHRLGKWLFDKRLDPEQILTGVVRQQEKRTAALREALARCEKAEADISRHIATGNANIANLETEAKTLAGRGDDLGARAALYKLNLERQAVASFEEQLRTQKEHVAESRRRLYLIELQLRQYEVGRSILLSQLAEAKTVEQQFAIANNFDPFSAIANWNQAEGMVQEKALTARAAERVYSDIVELPPVAQAKEQDAAALDAQLAQLKASLESDEPAPAPRKQIAGNGSERNGR
jgi:phage shock protein A